MGSNETRNLWLSVIAGVFASFLLYSYSQEKKAEYDKKFGSTKTVVVAKQNIAEMETIFDTMLDTRRVPSDYVDPNAISNKDEIVGKVAAVPIQKDQQIPKNVLLTPGPDTGISNQVALNKRAVSIPIDEVRGVAKLIRPGDRVDIVVALDTGKGVNQKRESSILMQDVEVLATGVSVVNTIQRQIEIDSSGKNLIQTALTGDTKYSTITVEASPKEAQDLIYILSTAPGNIYFTLRNPNDKLVPARLPSSTVESVLNKPVFDSTTPTPPPVYQAPIVPQQPAAQPKANGNGYRRL
jgi:pilus assembly protein CpaB